MQSVTLGEVSGVLVFIAGILSAGGIIVGFMSKRFGKLMRESLEPTERKIEDVAKRVESVDMANCKNYLVSTISDVQNGVKLDSVARERFYENYDHYIEMGGNSYVKRAVEKLRKEGKL